jgi:hypothetical protein
VTQGQASTAIQHELGEEAAANFTEKKAVHLVDVIIGSKHHYSSS